VSQGHQKISYGGEEGINCQDKTNSGRALQDEYNLLKHVLSSGFFNPFF